MTEEIIIDCAFYKDGVCASPINKTCEYCKNIDVSKCYHKQLKRLEQENNSLEAQLNNITVQSNNAITALEQENKEIYENGQIEITKLCNEKTKYRSALEEINILVKNYCNACDEFKAKTYKNKNDCLYCNYGFIKNKIKEVLK